MTAVLIANPVARQVKAHPGLIARVAKILRECGVPVDVWLTAGPAQATGLARQAAEEGRELVIAAGGDGTINEVVNGLVGTHTALAVVPLGTGNVFGHYLGLDHRRLRDACGLAAHGHRHRVDVGCVNGRHFVCMAGVGLDAEIVARTVGPLKRCLGTYAFMLQFVTTVLRGNPWDYRGTLDGEPIEGSMWGLFVCNTAQYTVGVRLIPEAIEDDGELEFVFLNACPKSAVLRTGVQVFGRARPAATQPHMRVRRGSHLTLTTQPSTLWQVEGEVGGMTPIECRVYPRALTLVTPPPVVRVRQPSLIAQAVPPPA